MDNQHKLIKGYRDLNEVEIGAINDIKAFAEEIGVLVGKVEGINGVDKRWSSIAKTDLQRGFMALTRAVAQPTSF